ncbi:OCIA domain-containing protein 1 [Anoplophora glabripennis]|uniref:OCIA domain-containing protein 1 n=1 Tax=Anoplophora glabripennis TaxID=217634 RepID=UPI000874E87D|nr:OCIA domain-containing protein 1 [Anoplophora glabripennis]
MNNPNNDEAEKEPRRQFPGPHARNNQQYKFTPDELRVIRECNKESFYQRCLPLGALLGGGVYYGVKTGSLKPNTRFGATPKVLTAVVVGYFIGKFSYQAKCAEKLMQLPNSQLGEMLRQKRRGNLQESLDTSFGPGMSLAPFSGMSSYDTYSDLNPNSSLNMDTARPDAPGLDDYQRPSVDNPIYEEEMPPIQKHTTTYEELRKKNREEYQQKRIGNYREPAKPLPPPSKSSSETEDPSAAKTKYGDVWG